MMNETEIIGETHVFSTIADMLGFDLSAISPAKLLGSVILLVIMIAVSKIFCVLFARGIKKSRLTEGLKKFTVKAVRCVLYFLAIMIFCDSLGLPITSLLAVFSLLGLAVSLSVQALLSNVMSGISLLMLKPFDIGDYIETDIAGTVKNIGLFYTEIMTIDNKKVFIPNEKIIASRLINYHAETKRRIDIQVSAAYEHDISEVKAALSQAMESVPMILQEENNIIGVADYGSSGVIYDVCAWSQTENYKAARYALMEAIWESYAAHGIKIPFNRLEVDVVNGKT